MIPAEKMHEIRDMKVGVTGATGFIGGYVVEELVRRGAKVEQFLRHKDQVEEFAKRQDCVINCAGVNRGSFDAMKTVNVEFLERLCRANRRVLNVSTTHVYKNTGYGATKRLGELSEDGPYASLRVPNVFGPGARPFYNSVVATWIQQAITDIPITVKGRNKLLGLVYVTDLASKLVWMISENRFFGDLNDRYIRLLRPSSVVTLGDLAEIIRKVSKEYDGREIEIWNQPNYPDAWDEVGEEFQRDVDVEETEIEVPMPLLEGVSIQYAHAYQTLDA